MEWAAYERVYGSIVPHERIDVGFAQVSLILAQAFGDGKRRFKMRDFMPPWFQELTKEDELLQGIEAVRGLIGADD